MLMVPVVHGRYCAIGTPVRTDVRAAPVFMTAGAAVQSARTGVCGRGWAPYGVFRHSSDGPALTVSAERRYGKSLTVEQIAHGGIVKTVAGGYGIAYAGRRHDQPVLPVDAPLGGNETAVGAGQREALHLLAAANEATLGMTEGEHHLPVMHLGVEQKRALTRALDVR